MKKFLSIALLLVFAVTAFAQQKDVTKFLGIPVDGTKAEMIEKLKAKGFTRDSNFDNVLDGEFNGNKVSVRIVTYKNKVYRIVVNDADTQDETNIRIRFNTLVQQFQNNKKYVPASFDKDMFISDKENIGHEILVNKKRYEADFYQLPQSIDTLAMFSKMEEIVSSKYTKEQLENPTDEVRKDLVIAGLSYVLDECQTRPVWFTIHSFNNEFYISLYYDNELNQANGEDL